MQVTLEIPDEFVKDLGVPPDQVNRKVLEEYALNGYRAERLTHYQVRRLMGFPSWQETEHFLRANGAGLHYSVDDLRKDRETLNRILGPA